MDLRTATDRRLRLAAQAGNRARSELLSRAAAGTGTSPEDDLVDDAADEADHHGSNALQEVSFGVRVAALWAVCFVTIVAALVVAVWLLNQISLVTITLTIAVMICALLQPIVGVLRRMHVPRGLAVVLVFIGGIGVIAFLTWFVISQIAYNKDTLIDQLGGAASGIRDWLIHGPLKMKSSDGGSWKRVWTLVGSIYESAATPVVSIYRFLFFLYAVSLLMLPEHQ